MSSNQSLSIFLLPNIGNVKAIKILKSINWKPNKYSQTDFIDQLYKNNFDRIDELTSLENTAPSEFEVLKNFDILETNNIISVKERINNFIKQPTFLPGKFN